MKMVISALAAALATAATAAGTSESYKLLFVPKAAGTVTVDGRIDEAAWEGAALIKDWHWTTRQPAHPECFQPPTEIRLLWDERNLYVAATCYEDTPANMESFKSLVNDRSCQIFFRDCVEMAVNGLANGNNPKIQIWLNATDERAAQRFADDGIGPTTDADYGKAMDWDKAFTVGPDYWQVEARFALSDLHGTGRPGSRLGINFGRFRLNKTFFSTVDRSEIQLGRAMSTFGWSSGRHGDLVSSRIILVEKEPASVLEGLKLSYPDLAGREILVQTDDAYIVVKDGRASELRYSDKSRELAARAKPAWEKLIALKAEVPEPQKGFYADRFKAAEAAHAKMEEAIATYAGDVKLTAAALEDLGKKSAGWEKTFDDAYWLTLKDLVRLEGKVRHPVKLEYREGVPASLSVLETCWFKPWERHYEGPKWAKPLAAKRPRALVHAYKGDSYAAWGLANRLDLDMDVWETNDYDGRYHRALKPSGDYGITEEQKVHQLENLLAKNDYDAYVFIGVDPGLWPARLQCALAERLLKGARAVEINGRGWSLPLKGDRSLVAGNPPSIATLDYPVGFCFNTYYRFDYREGVYKFRGGASCDFGRGSYYQYNPGSSFNYLSYNVFTPGFQNRPCDSFQDEYVRASNVRAVMQGLGLRGPDALDEIVTGTFPIDRAFTMKVKGHGTAGRRAKLRVTVRDGVGRTVVPETTSEVTFGGAADEFAAALPALPFGRYGVTATLLDGKGGVLDFVNGYAYVRDEGAKIDSLRMAKPCFAPGETVAAEVTVKNPEAGLAVEAAIRDPRMRTLVRGTFPVGADGRAAIFLSDRRLTRNCHFVVASLVKDGRTVDRAETEFYRHVGDEGDFQVFGDSTHASNEDFRMRQAMLEWYGIELSQSGTPTRHFWGGSPVVRDCTDGKRNRFFGTVGAKWYGPRLAALYRKHAEELRDRNGRYLSIGDDCSPAYFFGKDLPDWVTPFVDRAGRKHGRKHVVIRSCDAAVRLAKNELVEEDAEDLKAALAEAYGDDVFLFNRQNGLRLSSIAEATVAKMREIAPPESCEFANFTAFVRERYGRDLAKLNAAWHTDLGSFYDITEKTLDEAKFAGHYRATLDKYAYFEHLADYVFGSIADAVHAVDPTIGVGMGASMYMNLLPQCLKHLDTHCPYYPEELDNGRMMKCRYLGVTAGCYYDYRTFPNLSTYTIWHSVLGGANFGWFWSAPIAWRGDQAVHPGYIGWQLAAYRELSRGAAPLLIRSKRENDGVRILYSTPSAYMTTLVDRDGTHPGSRAVFSAMVENLGFQYDYALDESVAAGELEKDGDRLLILPCAKRVDAAAAKAIRRFVENGGVLMADVKPAAFNEDGYELKQGLLDDLFDLTPGRVDKDGAKLSVKRVGRGLTIYWGVNPLAWKFLVKNGEAAAARRDLLAALAQAGIRPRYATVAKDGRDVAGVEYTRFTRDGLTCLAVEKKPSSLEKYPLAASVKLDAPAWVYDVRAGRALGKLAEIPVEFEGYDTKLYSLLPYEVKGLKLEMPETVARGGTLRVTAKIDADGARTHLVRFDLVPKGGYTYEKFAPVKPQFLDAKNGVATAEFAIAYDEADGFTLEATDVVTGAKASRPVVFDGAEELFGRWMDAFMKLQVKGTGSKELDGGFLCPACEWQHGRTPDAVWPLCWAWKRTGERKYLDAAVGLVRWGRVNMERKNGAWINDPNAQWRGTTVFGQTALGRALVACGADLPAEVKADWTDCFRRMTDYCYGWIENPKTQVNVNYRAAYPLAMEFAYRVLGDEKYRRSGDGQMAIVAKFIADDGLFFGEAAPSDRISPRGLRGVDMGYNAEESLPAMLEWADLRGDRAKMRLFLDSAKAHLAFLLPDGGLDNSFGSRAYKWTYWGSRTSDGMLPMLVYLAKDGVKGAARAAGLQLALYRRCTGADGLLTGGIHYPESGEPACVHHTFCHLKTLPTFIEARLGREDEGTLLSERPFPLRRYRTNGVSICRVGDWRATFSENDLYFWDDRGKQTGGGSLTFLWNAAVGPVFAASMSEWYLQENGSMQQQKLDDVTRCLTPRLETADGALKSVHDNAVVHSVAEAADGTVTSSAKGVLADKDNARVDPAVGFTLDWTVAKTGVRAKASAAKAARLVVPVIAGSKDAVRVEGRRATVERNGRRLVLTSNRDFDLERTERPDTRAFSPQTGFLSACFSVPVLPGEPTEFQIAVE